MARIRRAASQLLSVLGSWIGFAAVFVCFVVGPLIVLWAIAPRRHHGEFGRWVDRLLEEHPTILIVALVSSLLPSVIGGLMYRDFRKNYPALEANRKKKQVEAIQAMQDVSYWLDNTARTEARPKATSMEITEASRLARQHVKREIRNKGFKLPEVSAAEITRAANALLAARPVAMIEQAKANVARWNTRSQSRRNA
jgi:hypothetical protein